MVSGTQYHVTPHRQSRWRRTGSSSVLLFLDQHHGKKLALIHRKNSILVEIDIHVSSMTHFFSVFSSPTVRNMATLKDSKSIFVLVRTQVAFLARLCQAYDTVMRVTGVVFKCNYILRLQIE